MARFLKSTSFWGAVLIRGRHLFWSEFETVRRLFKDKCLLEEIKWAKTENSLNPIRICLLFQLSWYIFMLLRSHDRTHQTNILFLLQTRKCIIFGKTKLTYAGFPWVANRQVFSPESEDSDSQVPLGNAVLKIPRMQDHVL